MISRVSSFRGSSDRFRGRRPKTSPVPPIPPEPPQETVTPTPSMTPSVTPSLTPSLSVSLTPTITPSITPSITISATPSKTPSITPSISPSITPSITPSKTPSATPSVTPSTSRLVGGSINLAGTSYLSLAASSDWAVGTGDFTVEWFQYQQNNGNENFIFDLGTSDNLAVSVASGGNKLNVYVNGAKVSTPTISNSLNTWYHAAISRVSNNLYVYMNGTRIDNIPNLSNVTDNTSTFYIGCENPGSPTGDNWPGYIASFRFIKGVGLYSGTTLTIPISPLPATAETKLLLRVLDAPSFITDSSSVPKTVTNNGGATYIASSPF